MLTRTFALRLRLKPAAVVLLAVSLALFAPIHALAQSAQDDPDRQRAFELFEDNQYPAALSLLEKLGKKYPADGQVLSRLGLVVTALAVTITDVEKRKQERARGRAILVRAKELGVTNDLMEEVLKRLAPDGSAVGAGDGSGAREDFSPNREADEAMRAGESAFTRGDLDGALKAYERALQIDPKIYEAPLFAGDLFMQKQEWDRAAEWYARAVQINPDRETAHRYWGDSLLRQARLDAARDKFVDAIIAEPYNGYVWQNGLFRWADKKGINLGHPKIEPMSSLTPTGENKMTITIDPKSLGKTDDGTSVWLIYGISRAAWATNDYAKFKKEYPGEKQYRHSLREEADALRMVAQMVKEQTKDGKIKRLDPALEQLVKLHDDGLLEAYILFSRVLKINSIAEDYVAYRKANRDKLRRYLLEYIASGKY